MKINLQGLIVKLVNLTQDKKKLSLAIITTVIILFLDLSFVLKPQVASVRSFNDKIVRLRLDLKSLKLDLDMMQIQVDRPLASKMKQVITENQTSSLIEEIYKLSNRNKVKILQIRPLKAEKVATSRLLVLPLNMELSCGYHSLVNFISELEGHPIIMSVDGLGITRRQKDIFFHKVNLTLNTYVTKK